MLRLRVIQIAVGMGLAAAIAGCASTTQRAQLSSAYPLDRVRAAVRAADVGDPGAVDLLVGMLEDDDAGVRMYAIMALERLCGETYEYCYYAPEPTRNEAVGRWRAARQRGEVTLQVRAGILDQPSGTTATRTTAGSEQTP